MLTDYFSACPIMTSRMLKNISHKLFSQHAFIDYTVKIWEKDDLIQQSQVVFSLEKHKIKIL